MDYHWKNIRIDTGLRNLNMHDLRHIVGGYGVNNGFSLEVVGKTLGHTTKYYPALFKVKEKRLKLWLIAYLKHISLGYSFNSIFLNIVLC